MGNYILVDCPFPLQMTGQLPTTCIKVINFQRAIAEPVILLQIKFTKVPDYKQILEVFHAQSRKFFSQKLPAVMEKCVIRKNRLQNLHGEPMVTLVMEAGNIRKGVPPSY